MVTVFDGTRRVRVFTAMNNVRVYNSAERMKRFKKCACLSERTKRGNGRRSAEILRQSFMKYRELDNETDA